MTSISTQGPVAATATIYQFPVGGRAGLTTSRDQGKLTARPASSDLAVADAWYHQVAILESQQGTKQ